MNINDFIEALDKLNIQLSDKQLQQFEKYYHFLIEWNQKMNLTAITSKEEVYEKHFYDSILASQVYDFSNQKICDVGAGAGFPSIPLMIVFEELDVTIVDSLAKRISFLNALADELELTHFTAVAARAEEYASEHREQFDLVMARAVARLNILSELCLPLVKVDGYFLALKGKQGLEEDEEAQTAIKLLGAIQSKIAKYHLLSDKSTRYLMLYHKVKSTHHKYPRNYALIKKKTL